MSPKAYEPNQLISILDSLLKKKRSGILNLITQADLLSQQRTSLLILSEGALVYGGTSVPQASEFCLSLGKSLKSNLIEQALSVAQERAKNPDSIAELLDMLIRMKALTWPAVESLMCTKVLLIVEKFLPYPGKAAWAPSNDFSLHYGPDKHGLNWGEIQQDLKVRGPKWRSLKPHIPSMDAVPIINVKQLKLIDNPEVRAHLEKSVDGKSSLVEIAESMNKDPLKVAKSYLNWCHNGWVGFVDSEKVANNKKASSGSSQASSDKEKKSNLPIVLSVDDSPIIQTCIKRALQEEYQVLLASEAAEAMKILNEVRVELMLLDLTMPDVDGLEFCKQIRNISKFRDLPVVMVTARDGLVNKMRGHIAGSNRYLTKPFDAKELKQVVSQFLKP